MLNLRLNRIKEPQKRINKFENIQIITKFALRFRNSNNKLTIFIMIVVPVKEGENIERALKRFKRKFEKTGVIKELRGRQAFTKPSVVRRAEIKKAIYIEQLQSKED